MCYCGSNDSFENCCEKYLAGKEYPTTALLLMKSRYSAFVTKNINYLMSTAEPGVHISHKSLEDWVKKIEWSKLKIIKTNRGEESDTLGEVEFKAFYTKNNSQKIQHEKSYFKKTNNKWFYVAGELNPVDLKFPKMNRNDVCNCGSGKKYKKCCAI